LPFTVLTDPDTVRLVAGEDHRYTLTGPGLDQWLPDLLAGCDGRQALDDLLGRLPEHTRRAARSLVDRLYGERVLVDGTASEAHTAGQYRLEVEGTGPLSVALAHATAAEDGKPLPVFCQDRLDYDAALQFNRRCLRGASPWLWVSTGPMSRGYVSPPFLPGAGPCLACLLRHFQRLSPAPELYDALTEHSHRGGAIAPVPFPVTGLRMLELLVRWKVDQLALPEPPAALYRLHVLEVATMEVSTHRVFVDPECPECGDAAVV
jgi:bacteriocin biosynthesis cyclodehydratase domain-containing protein